MARHTADALDNGSGRQHDPAAQGLPVLGLVPYYRHIEIESEDGMPLEVVVDPPSGPSPEKINIAVLRFPHISNFTDFAPLAREPIVYLHYLSLPRSLGGYDVVILPGTKNVRSDLEWMRKAGWHAYLERYFIGSGKICGICGGYQMLGRLIRDPYGMEGRPGESSGLGLLDVQTTLAVDKTLSRSTGIRTADNQAVEGYEIHMGVTERIGNTPGVIRVTNRNGRAVDEMDGAATASGNVWGTYFHGLFDLPDFRSSFLDGLKPELSSQLDCRRREPEKAFKEKQYDLLAEHFKTFLEMPKLLEIVGI